MAVYRVDGPDIGWMLVTEAESAQDALRIGKASADSASLLPSDITRARLATADDIAWYRGMSGHVTPHNQDREG